MVQVRGDCFEHSAPFKDARIATCQGITRGFGPSTGAAGLKS